MACVKKPATTARTIINAELANVATRMVTARRVVLLSPEQRSQALSAVQCLWPLLPLSLLASFVRVARGIAIVTREWLLSVHRQTSC